MDGNLIERLSNKLSENNYKITAQRRDIIKVLTENADQHFSAEELYHAVKEINSDVGLATIYRSLELLNELGIVHELDFDNNYRRYELTLDENHHHHLICLKCGRIIEFNDQVLEEFEQGLEHDYKFKIMDHRIKFYGLCKNCVNTNHEK